MVAHGGVSERLVVPSAHMRCYTIGIEGDNASVPAPARKYARFCDNPNMSSILHTQGFAEFVEPALLFLRRALGAGAGAGMGAGGSDLM